MNRMTFLAIPALILALGCGGETTPTPPPTPAPDTPGGGTSEGPTDEVFTSHRGHTQPSDEVLLAKYDTSLPMVKYGWDPNAGDTSVPAEMGGPGFTGEGWETNMEFPAMGSPEAKKGGQMTLHIADWPATLRLTGKDYNTEFNYMMADMAQEGMLTLNPTTLEWVPVLATHWQISEDKSTYRYRLNPEARWSDGDEVTAEDVVASWKLRMDPGILFPSAQVVFSKFEEPKAISKYIVEVTTKEENWRNFLYFSTMAIFPANEISIPGGEYLEKYQFSYHSTTGPYKADPAEFEEGVSLTIRRRDDWWAKDNPAFTGLYNIDTYKVVVVKEPQLAFEMVKKGELDFYIVPKAQWWAEEIPKADAVERGLLQMKKIYNDAPIGTSGLAINMGRPPFDDVRMRLALNHLIDRPTMIEKLYFDEYEPMTSYFQGGIYENPDNQETQYDEVRAVELIEEMGWTEKNDEGYRVKDGKELGFTINYASPLSERSLTIYQEACKRAGIRVDLQILTPAAAWKNMTQKEFDLMSAAWGALVFPNPETTWLSELADKPDNNNITAYANPKVDELCNAYDREYDATKRPAIIQEIDGLVFNDHPYVLEWYNPAQRFLYWRKIQLPKFGTARTWDRYSMHYCFWIDPDMEKKVDAAKKDGSTTMEPEEIKNFWWRAYKLKEGKS